MLCPYCFRILGTPNENVWPGVTQLKYWNEFCQWKPVKLEEEVPDMDRQGLDLLAVSFILFYFNEYYFIFKVIFLI